MADGGFRRTIFDCKTTNKLSAINRAFWAAGLARYVDCDEAVVILKNRAVYNHRISALRMNIDLHDELSLEDLGRTFSLDFAKDNFYQSSVDRWNVVYDTYQKNAWADHLYDIGRNLVPLATEPWRLFRRMVVEMRAARGHVDPAKQAHVVIFLDVLAATFILWSSLGRDIRRLYDPAMKKEEFERALRYYIWGGKESYQLRQELRHKAEGNNQPQDFPAWDKLIALASLVISAPQDLFGCVNICRDLSIRLACGKDEQWEKRLSAAVSENKRARQFIMAATDYAIAAANFPKDLSGRVQAEFEGL